MNELTSVFGENIDEEIEDEIDESEEVPDFDKDDEE